MRHLASQLGSLLASVITAVAPLAVFSQGVQDAAGELGVYLSVIVGGVGLYRYVVLPLQRITGRVERIPHIERRVSALEKGLGVQPPAEDT